MCALASSLTIAIGIYFSAHCACVHGMIERADGNGGAARRARGNTDCVCAAISPLEEPRRRPEARERRVRACFAVLIAAADARLSSAASLVRPPLL